MIVQCGSCAAKDKVADDAIMWTCQKCGEMNVVHLRENHHSARCAKALELEKRMTVKDAGSKQVYSFYFHFGEGKEEGKVWDERVTASHNELTDCSQFLNAWQSIRRALER
jgi:predicted RNA-binding Zn-ribbon protein involved in translation (DUF1610 family)